MEGSYFLFFSISGFLSFFLILLSVFKILDASKLNKKTAQLNLIMSREDNKSAITRLKSKQNECQLKIIKSQAPLDTLSQHHRKLKQTTYGINVGLNPATFSFDDPESLKDEINNAREEQLILTKAKEAMAIPSSFTLKGDLKKGLMMIRAIGALLLKAFNEEFEVIRKQMRYNTLDKAQDKLERLVERLDNLGEPYKISIEYSYFILKESELEIWNEDLQRRQGEKEEKKFKRHY